MSNTAFHPGQPWFDTEGKRIQAHGGSVFYENGVFYWYGENKEKTHPGNGILQWGVRYYSSTDLCNWKDEGLLIPPNTEDSGSLLHPSSKAERPHILFCDRTGKYVCWIKVIRGAEQIALVLEADAFTGPYHIVREGYKPFGMCMGDFDLIKDEQGKAWLIFEHPHNDLICGELDESYTGDTDNYTVNFERIQPPFVREAPACFRHEGQYYMLTSGTTGYHPNPSESAASDQLSGPWKELGDLHPEDRSRTSYGSQISSVFSHPGKKNLYIALGDRWMYDLREQNPEEYDAGITYEKIHNNFLWTFSGKPELAEWTVPAPDTSLADYVWLPVTFEDGKPVIHWRDKWRVEEFE